MTYETFLQHFGKPRSNTTASLESLRLDHSRELSQFVAEAKGGVFGDGFISIVSVREQVPDLGGWQAWLPEGARLFATSAFGVLYATRGDDVWVVNTQYGEIIESDLSMREAIIDLASPETREELFQESLFQAGNAIAGPLADDSVLCPVPAIPLGGSWSAQTLKQMPLVIYLSFTAQLFGPEPGTEVHVIRRGE